jgi:DNA-binding MarR family transcriptional regulator
MYLQRRETASISEISDYLNLSLAATSHLVERLVASRFVTRAEDPNDRRLKQVTLTAEGGAMVEEVKQTRVEETAKRLATMSLPLRQALLDSMEQAVGYLRTTDALNGESNKAR